MDKAMIEAQINLKQAQLADIDARAAVEASRIAVQDALIALQALQEGGIPMDAKARAEQELSRLQDKLKGVADAAPVQANPAIKP